MSDSKCKFVWLTYNEAQGCASYIPDTCYIEWNSELCSVYMIEQKKRCYALQCVDTVTTVETLVEDTTITPPFIFSSREKSDSLLSRRRGEKSQETSKSSNCKFVWMRYKESQNCAAYTPDSCYTQWNPEKCHVYLTVSQKNCYTLQCEDLSTSKKSNDDIEKTTLPDTTPTPPSPEENLSSSKMEQTDGGEKKVEKKTTSFSSKSIGANDVSQSTMAAPPLVSKVKNQTNKQTSDDNVTTTTTTSSINHISRVRKLDNKAKLHDKVYREGFNKWFDAFHRRLDTLNSSFPRRPLWMHPPPKPNKPPISTALTNVNFTNQNNSGPHDTVPARSKGDKR